ncbi:hypothetical protein AB0J72_46225 [Dactylosporangium sp. NPDC049742]
MTVERRDPAGRAWSFPTPPPAGGPAGPLPAARGSWAASSDPT